MSTSGARQWRVPCPCSEAIGGRDGSMHSQVSGRNLSYFISEGRVPSDVDEGTLREWYERARATDRTLVVCNHCRTVRLVDGEREDLAGPEPRGGFL